VAGYLDDLQEWAPFLLHGLQVTLVVSVVSMALSTMLGLALALVRLMEAGPIVRVLKVAIRIYIDVLRGLPLIVTLFIIYFALPTLGLTLVSDPLPAGIVGMTLALGAYLSEVFRAAILSVDPGQMEAALSLGMSRPSAYRRIVLPQALLVAVPTLGGYFISLLKDSSLLSFISVTELLRTAMDLVSITFKAVEIYLTIGVMYLIISTLAALAVSAIERRMRPLERALTGVSRLRPPVAGAGVASPVVAPAGKFPRDS